MKIKIVLFLLTFSISYIISAKDNKIYFDKDWKKTTEENATYYRIIKDLDSIYYVEDFYMSNNKLQAQCYSKTKVEPFYYEGKVLLYYENGQIQEEGYFINNQRNGITKTYYPTGQIKTICNYKNDLKNGQYKSYSFNGNIDLIVDIVNEKGNGDFIVYNSDNGNLISKGTLVNNIQHGKCEKYYQEDYLKQSTINYKYDAFNGLIDGNFYEFSKEGDTISWGVFNKGKPIAFTSVLDYGKDDFYKLEMKLNKDVEEWKLFKNGIIIRERQFINGIKTGDWKYYTYKGELYEIENYNNLYCKESYLQKLDSNLNETNLSYRFNLKEILYYRNHDSCTGNRTYYNEEVYNKFISDLSIMKNGASGNGGSAVKVILYDSLNCNEQKYFYICYKEIAGMKYYLITTQNAQLLDSLYNSHRNNEKDNEIYFFLETNQNINEYNAKDYLINAKVIISALYFSQNYNFQEEVLAMLKVYRYRIFNNNTNYKYKYDFIHNAFKKEIEYHYNKQQENSK